LKISKFADHAKLRRAVSDEEYAHNIIIGYYTTKVQIVTGLANDIAHGIEKQ